jgi:hypothetical protein
MPFDVELLWLVLFLSGFAQWSGHLWWLWCCAIGLGSNCIGLVYECE